MTQKTTAIVQEALAVIGVSLFAFGVWQIYHPACFILTGMILTTPFLVTLRRAK